MKRSWYVIQLFDARSKYFSESNLWNHQKKKKTHPPHFQDGAELFGEERERERERELICEESSKWLPGE